MVSEWFCELTYSTLWKIPKLTTSFHPTGIGRSVEAYAQLLVFQAPRVKMSFDFSKTSNGLHQNLLNRLSSSVYNTVVSGNLNTISVKKGDQASFTCSAIGTQPVSIEWLSLDYQVGNTSPANTKLAL